MKLWTLVTEQEEARVLRDGFAEGLLSIAAWRDGTFKLRTGVMFGTSPEVDLSAGDVRMSIDVPDEWADCFREKVDGNDLFIVPSRLATYLLNDRQPLPPVRLWTIVTDEQRVLREGFAYLPNSLAEQPDGRITLRMGKVFSLDARQVGRGPVDVLMSIDMPADVIECFMESIGGIEAAVVHSGLATHFLRRSDARCAAMAES